MVAIYKITSPTNRVYIGQSKDVQHRFYRYKTYQCKKQPLLYASLTKHTSEKHSFEIVYEFPEGINRGEMDNYEQFFILQYKEAGISLLNLNEGGKTNKELSDSTRKKLSDSAKGKKYWLGRKHTEEAKEKIRKGNTGKKFTAERLKNMSEGNKGKVSSRKGVIVSAETKDKMRLARLGKKLTTEQRNKISQGLKGRIFSDETRRKLSIAGKGKKQTIEHTRNNVAARKKRNLNPAQISLIW